MRKFKVIPRRNQIELGVRYWSPNYPYVSWEYTKIDYLNNKIYYKMYNRVDKEVSQQFSGDLKQELEAIKKKSFLIKQQ